MTNTGDLEALAQYLVHSYFECIPDADDCQCGLNELTDRLGLPRCESYPG